MAEVTCSKCGKTCKSLQGWKMHMSGAHGGYDDSDLAEAAGVAGGEGNVRARMESFAETMPGAGDESSPTTQRRVDGEPGPSSAPAPLPEGRRVRATPKKLRKILGGIPAKILEQSGIELDRDDNEALDEAGEFLGDIFGFEFSVPESKVLVQSRWWAVLWVAGVAGLVYIKHRFPEVFKAVFRAVKKDGETETDKMDNGSQLSDNPL